MTVQGQLPEHDGRVDWDALCAKPEVDALIDLSLREDIGDGDATTAIVDDVVVDARIVVRTETVTCGMPLLWKILGRFDPDGRLTRWKREGERVSAGGEMAALRARARALLTVERTLLNFGMRLCGIAYAAHQAVSSVPPGCPARIFDTRKTVPGWRLLDKAAVRTGGACNHRLGLYDAAMIKDNHLLVTSSMIEAVARLKAEGSRPVELEIDALEQLDEALAAKPDVILLDNMPHKDVEEAVRRVGGALPLEVSGGIRAGDIARWARTGVDRISAGYLTHSVTPADLSLELV